MSSNSYDGEYMGRIIHKFGFVAVKGSSSRNAVRALLGLRRALQQGWAVAFALDGPRGPRHKVKPGPVALARSSGTPLTMFHIAVDRAWVLNTWDRLIIPKPFSRVLMRFGKLIRCRRMPATKTSITINRICRIRSTASANSPRLIFKRSARQAPILRLESRVINAFERPRITLHKWLWKGAAEAAPFKTNSNCPTTQLAGSFSIAPF